MTFAKIHKLDGFYKNSIDKLLDMSFNITNLIN